MDIGLQPLQGPLTVDVIIPVRNRVAFIGECLDSVRAQTFQPANVLVVDDGSTDGTAAILADYARAWPRLRTIVTPPRGISAARNTALAVSTASLVAFMDSDDTWQPEKVARQVALFTADRPRLGLVYCGLQQINEKGRPLETARPIIASKRGDVFKDMLQGFLGIAPSTIVARRDVVLAVGCFDETLIMAEDRDLCLKIARMSLVDCIPDPLVGLRSHDGGSYIRAMNSNPEGVLFQRLRVWNRWRHEMDDIGRVLKAFRTEALSASVFNIFRRRPRFGLYGRLSESDMQLAKELFAGRLDYIHALVAFLTRSSGEYIAAVAIRPAKSALAKVKPMIAQRVILRYKPLLRLAQWFGRFRT